MKVILESYVKGQGNVGEVVDVSDGYARNYLIPNGLAKVASKGNIKQAKKQKESEKEKEAKKEKKVESLAKELEGKTFKIEEKSKDEKLFGSVDEKRILDILKKEKVATDLIDVELKSPIKKIGTHKVRLLLNKKNKVDIEVEIKEEK